MKTAVNVIELVEKKVFTGCNLIVTIVYFNISRHGD